MKKAVVFSLALVLVTACGITREAMPFDHLAQCLTDKGAVMYGADDCPHCKAQKASFKGSFDLVTYVECRQNPLKCQEAEVAAFPTWVINGEKTEGRKSLGELAELAGCSLKADAAPAEEAASDEGADEESAS